AEWQRLHDDRGELGVQLLALAAVECRYRLLQDLVDLWVLVAHAVEAPGLGAVAAKSRRLVRIGAAPDEEQEQGVEIALRCDLLEPLGAGHDLGRHAYTDVLPLRGNGLHKGRTRGCRIGDALELERQAVLFAHALRVLLPARAFCQL